MARLTDAQLLASIREATAAWNAFQDAEYYAAKHGFETPVEVLVMLRRLTAAGLVTRHRTRTFGGWMDTWEVKEETL